MRWVTVGAAALNQTPLDWDGNREHIVEAIRLARAAEVSILCLPELCVTGYGCEDAFGSAGLLDTAGEMLESILPETWGMAVSLGLPLLHRGGLFNVAALAVNGGIAGFVAKRHLAGEGLHYEPRWFKAWPEGVRAETLFRGNSYPMGDICFDLGGVRIGFEICEDAWVARRPGGGLAQRGVDIILNPSASHFAFGKRAVRRRFVLEGSRAFGVTYIYSNLLGNEAGRAIYDGDTLIASGGEMVAEGRRFGYATARVTPARIDLDATRMLKARTASFAPSMIEDPLCVPVAFAVPTALPPNAYAGTGSRVEPWEGRASLEFEEFTRALPLALFDYMRKSRSNGFVVSLSGGADSAMVACLIAMAIRSARTELGPAAFAGRLQCLQAENAGEISEAQWVSRLLTCVYQATNNSSETTRLAAEEVAAALGARFIAWDVDPLVRGYTAIVEQVVGRRLSWRSDDVALQNIQARVRAPGVWMLANLSNSLLVATSNRSEVAVGYATMDGDTCGGLSPIAGIDKAFILECLRWLERNGPAGMGPIPALAAVNRQVPTAELRPASASGERQTDEQDLMPYELLEGIEAEAIGGKRMPAETLAVLAPRFPGLSDAELRRCVARFYRLWSRNQWKRERYAPSFHVDDRNLDPRSWCRFPILSGGFARELAGLERAAES